MKHKMSKHFINMTQKNYLMFSNNKYLHILFFFQNIITESHILIFKILQQILTTHGAVSQ